VLCVASDHLSHSSTFDSKACQHHPDSHIPARSSIVIFRLSKYLYPHVIWTDGVDFPYSWLDTNLHKASIEPRSPGSISELRRESVGYTLVKAMQKFCCAHCVRGYSTKPDWGLVQKRLIPVSASKYLWFCCVRPFTHDLHHKLYTTLVLGPILVVRRRPLFQCHQVVPPSSPLRYPSKTGYPFGSGNGIEEFRSIFIYRNFLKSH